MREKIKGIIADGLKENKDLTIVMFLFVIINFIASFNEIEFVKLFDRTLPHSIMIVYTYILFFRRDKEFKFRPVLGSILMILTIISFILCVINLDSKLFLSFAVCLGSVYVAMQFYIIYSNNGEKNKGIRYPDTPHGRPVINGKEKYLRILIKNKHPGKLV